MVLNQRYCVCPLQNDGVGVNTASLVLMKRRLVDVSHFGVVPMEDLAGLADLGKRSPKIKQTFLQNLSPDFELPVGLPTRQPQSTQKLPDPFGVYYDRLNRITVL